MTERIGKNVKKYPITIFWIINSKVQVRMFFLKHVFRNAFAFKNSKACHSTILRLFSQLRLFHKTMENFRVFAK